MKFDISNVLAVAGAVSIVVGVGMFKPAAGIIALGLVLILGAVATVKSASGKTQ